MLSRGPETRHPPALPASPPPSSCWQRNKARAPPRRLPCTRAVPGHPHLLGFEHLPLEHIGDAVSNHLKPACTVAMEPTAPLQDSSWGADSINASDLVPTPGRTQGPPSLSRTHGGPRGHAGPPLSLHRGGRALHLGCGLVHDPLHHALVQPGEWPGCLLQVTGLPWPLDLMHGHGRVWVLLGGHRQAWTGGTAQ